MASHLILDNFYKSRTWIDFRLYLIYQRTTPKGTYCEHCGNIIEDEAQVIAHHKKELTPENVKDRMISLNPDNIMLVQLALELGAVLVLCDATKAECIRRLSVDIDRQYRRDEWCKYIDEWFDSYT